MITCNECGIRYDPNEVDPCAFCEKDPGLCPECLEQHENDCSENPEVTQDYSEDPRNER